MVQLREAKPSPISLPPGYDMKVMCEAHSGIPRHTLEDFKGFKYKVQDLIDSKDIMFTPNRMNIMYTHMPPHTGTTPVP